MIKKVFITFLFILLVSSIYSQRKAELGFTSGVEWSIPTSRNPTMIHGYIPYAGFNIGLRFKHNFTHTYSIISGFEYARMYFGKKQEYFIGPTIPEEPKVNMYYANQLRIPVLFQLNLGKNKSKFFINTGPCFLYTFADETRKNNGMDIFYNYPDRLFEAANIAGLFGLGYSYTPVSYVRIFAQSRIMIPLLTAPHHLNSPFNENVNSYYSVRTLTISANVGVTFLLHQYKVK